MPPRRAPYGRNAYLQSLAHPTVGKAAQGAARAMGMPAPPADKPPVLGPSDTSFNIYPWWDKKSDGAQDWFTTARAFSLAGGATNSAITGISFVVPSNTRAVLKQFLMEVINPTTAIDVYLTLLRNGQPIVGWNNTPFRAMSASYQGLPYNDVNILLDEGETFTASYTNGNAATTWTTGLQVSGWFINKTDIKRLSGNLRY